MQEDPHPGKLSTPISFNSRYVYSANNSVNYVDPNGDLPFLVVAALIGAGLGTLDALSSGGDVLQGALFGAVSGVAIGAGIWSAGLLTGGGTGVWALVSEMAVSAFLSGLFNASALSILRGNSDNFVKDFTNGAIGGALGTGFKSLGVAEGIEVGTESKGLGAPQNDVGDEMTKKAIRDLKIKMKFQLGI